MHNDQLPHNHFSNKLFASYSCVQYFLHSWVNCSAIEQHLNESQTEQLPPLHPIFSNSILYLLIHKRISEFIPFYFEHSSSEVIIKKRKYSSDGKERTSTVHEINISNWHCQHTQTPSRKKVWKEGLIRRTKLNNKTSYFNTFFLFSLFHFPISIHNMKEKKSALPSSFHIR